MALINEVIPIQGFDLVGQKIASILLLELTNQINLQSLTDDLGVFLERTNPYDKSVDLMVNVSCNNVSYSYFQKYSKFVDIKPFYVEEENFVEGELSWQRQDEIVINGNNFGLNMNFTVNCDLTDLIIQQKTLFIPVVQQMAVVAFLKDIINSTRDTSTANNLRGLVLANGTIQAYIKTEEDRLKKRVASTSLDMNQLDSTCMQNTVRRIRTGSF